LLQLCSTFSVGALSFITVALVVVFYKLCVFLIDTEVRQVNEFFVESFRIQVVLLGGEPDETIVVNVHF